MKELKYTLFQRWRV